MSCGKPHETDCSEVLAEVWLLLDHECDEGRRKRLEQHLDECHPCLEQYGIEEHLKILLARKCGGDHAPDSFKERLRSCIRDAVATQLGVAAPRQAMTDSVDAAAGHRDQREEAAGAG